uniref:Uncharacterized protein n=1 Tax=viral metagenome TaxID=1070528 RepID=A0A6C0JS68_9ZZZZ
MEFEFDKNFKIVRKLRPYINMEETNKNIVIFNPENGPDYGLYSNKYFNSCSDPFFNAKSESEARSKLLALLKKEKFHRTDQYDSFDDYKRK